MSLLRLALANLTISRLSSAVNVLLLALGTASIAVLLLASAQLSSSLTRNAAGIDLVIGAKGSPLQLVLSGVYHADVPPGNIPYEEAARWAEHPMVESAIPLSLGDSYEGYRIVGTITDFATLYDADLQTGNYWDKPFEAVLGSNVADMTGLKVGDTFSGVHGLADDGDQHESSPYSVVGQFTATDSVLDNLIVTSTQSVWLMHSDHEHDKETSDYQSEPLHTDEHHDDEDEHHDHDNEYHGDEVTLLLIKLSSPMGLLSLPKEVNAESALQAASPAYEVTRLLQIVGIGLNWLNAFAGVLILSAALSIFAALYASLRARRHDLAVMRCLGATRGELFYLLFIEGLTLTVLGIAIGLCFAHGGMELLGNWLGDGQGLTISGWAWAQEEFVLIAGLLVTGSLTALLPAWQAYQTDVSRTLSSP